MSYINEMVQMNINGAFTDGRMIQMNINGEYHLPRIEESESYILELSKPELSDGEYAVARIEKHKIRKMNPKSNRMKKFKTTKWMKTNVAPEDRTLKNLPRDSKKKAKCKFQDWLLLKNGSRSHHSVGQAPNGDWYGWSHRAVGHFSVGKEIKSADIIGNKHTYGKEIDKKYGAYADKHGYEAADKWRETAFKFTPYKIKSEAEAFQHAERFSRDVS